MKVMQQKFVKMLTKTKRILLPQALVLDMAFFIETASTDKAHYGLTVEVVCKALKTEISERYSRKHFAEKWENLWPEQHKFRKYLIKNCLKAT